MIDLEYDDVDAAFAESVARLCEARLVRAARAVTAVWSHEWWRAVAELGVLGLTTPDGGGSVTTVAAAMESLGSADAPGPLVETFIAVQLLGEDAAAVVTGDEVVAVKTSETIAWLPIASAVIELDAGHAYRARVTEPIVPVDSLAGEPWGRAKLERLDDLGDATRAIAVGDVAAAAYLVGEADLLLTAAARYAADRVQFKNPIGNFQAVAHPLADCSPAARRGAHVHPHRRPRHRHRAIEHAAAAAATARRRPPRPRSRPRSRPIRRTVRWGSRSRARSATDQPRSARRACAGHSPGAGTEHILRQRGL